MTHVVVGVVTSAEAEAARLYRQFLDAREGIEASQPYELAKKLLRRAGHDHPTKALTNALWHEITAGITAKEVVPVEGRHHGVYRPKAT